MFNPSSFPFSFSFYIQFHTIVKPFYTCESHWSLAAFGGCRQTHLTLRVKLKNLPLPCKLWSSNLLGLICIHAHLVKFLHFRACLKRRLKIHLRLGGGSEASINFTAHHRRIHRCLAALAHFTGHAVTLPCFCDYITKITWEKVSTGTRCL